MAGRCLRTSIFTLLSVVARAKAVRAGLRGASFWFEIDGFSHVSYFVGELNRRITLFSYIVISSLSKRAFVCREVVLVLAKNDFLAYHCLRVGECQ